MQFMMLGAGYSAQAFGLGYGKKFSGKIYGTTRSPENFATLQKAHIKPLVLDFKNFSDEFFDALATTTHLVISIAPRQGNGKASDAVLDSPVIFAHMPKLEWIGYLSTIGVYGNHNGEWIDESAACHPSLQRNEKRLEVEKIWQEYGRQNKLAVAILRLGGIYGPSRNAFVKLRDGNKKLVIKPGQVFNRIHVDDIAGVINAFAQKSTNGIFNIVDNEPAPPQDVIRYAAELMGIKDLTEIPFEKAALSPMARSFYGDNKRILNHKLLKQGYSLKYLNYRVALDHMWMENLWGSC